MCNPAARRRRLRPQALFDEPVEANKGEDVRSRPLRRNEGGARGPSRRGSSPLLRQQPRLIGPRATRPHARHALVRVSTPEEEE